MLTLVDWEDYFRKALQEIDESKRQKAGVLLPVLPDRVDWNEFLGSVKHEWQSWRKNLDQFPHCLIILYDGLAFYEYDARKLWPQFSKAIGGKSSLPANQQSEVNEAFARAARRYDLQIHRRADSKDYVGSAVYHIGIPLSLWGGFLEICEWALAHGNWAELSEEEWKEVATRRSGQRTRLSNFLLNNREAASDFVKEMHDARKILIEDQQVTISDLQQASLLRQEYFDEVPETAEFLRPEDPDSLIRDRARLVWDEDQYRIYLQLPAVSHDKLPATWKIGALTQPAASTPDTLTLNAEAFAPSLVLELESGQQRKSQWLSGIEPWALFDLERNRFVNPECRQFPIHRYTLVSPKPLAEVSRKGFDEEDSPINQRYELEDGTDCYVTNLWPVETHAEISIAHAGETKKILFRPSFKIEARIFAGKGSYAANFSCHNERLKLERLPLLCIAIPFGSFEDTETALQCKFLVHVGEQLAKGIWEKCHKDDGREFYFWSWAPGLEPKKKVNISVKSYELGIKFDYPIEMLGTKNGTDECWQNFPGAFLPWILLAQPAVGTKKGMRWNDLLLAKEAIAPDQRLSANMLRKYERHGLLEQRGVRWFIAEARAVFEPMVDGEFGIRFCGNPAVLWSLFRYMSDYTSRLPIVEVVNRKGELPFLLMRWKEDQQKLVRKYLEKHEVRFVSDLWS